MKKVVEIFFKVADSNSDVQIYVNAERWNNGEKKYSMAIMSKDGNEVLANSEITKEHYNKLRNVRKPYVMMRYHNLDTGKSNCKFIK